MKINSALQIADFYIRIVFACGGLACGAFACSALITWKKFHKNPTMFNIKETDIIDIIYRKVKGDTLSPKEEKTIKKWIKRSVYYKALLDDIQTDQNLRNKLLSKYITDKLDFWTAVITYRTAMHSDQTKRKSLLSIFRSRNKKTL